MRGFRFYGICSVLAVLLLGCASEMGHGSSKSMYTVAEVLEVHREDLGKSLQLRLDQKVFFNFEADPEQPGEWSLVDYDRRVMLMLSDAPRVDSGNWGVLLQARSLGYGVIVVKFTPADDTLEPKTTTFSVSIRK